jgi:hypothetical protein
MSSVRSPHVSKGYAESTEALPHGRASDNGARPMGNGLCFLDEKTLFTGKQLVASAQVCASVRTASGSDRIDTKERQLRLIISKL